MDSVDFPVITRHMLTSHSLEVCEFCDKTSKNKYNSLIHNASHIIIPLIRQNFVQCKKCLVFCTSQNDLHQHIIVNHPVVIKTERLDFWDKDAEKKEDVTDVTDESDKKERSIEDVVVLQNGARDCLVKKVNITIDGNDASLEIKVENKPIVKCQEPKSKKPSIKDCLIFENDEDLDVLSNTPIQKFVKQVHFEDTNSKSVIFNGSPDGCVREIGNNDEIDTPLIFFTKQKLKDNESHYYVLTQGNKVFCRYCSAMFLSRFNLIVHEQTHMRFNQKIAGLLCLHCDKYIAGNYINLTKHIHNKHSKDKYKMHCTSVCKKCGLQYRSYKHHAHNYHSSKCCNINKFITEHHFKNHLEKCLCHSHVVSVCRQCFTILRDDINFKCVTLGIKRTSGVFQNCKKCDQKVNEIISVKLNTKIEPKFQYWYIQDRPLSNRDRLKNIRMRLKKLNIMSKMYGVVFFFLFSSFNLFTK